MSGFGGFDSDEEGGLMDFVMKKDISHKVANQPSNVQSKFGIHGPGIHKSSLGGMMMNKFRPQ